MSESSNPQVDVVIVAHNAGELLRSAVDSAIQQAGSDHVWVMDAESTDGSTTAIADRLPEGHLRAVPNAGFSASNNRGIELTAAPFVLLLNPDAVLGDGALAALADSAARNPRAGIIGPAVLNSDGSVQANSFGRFPTLVSVLGLRLWRAAQRVRGNRSLSPRLPAHTHAVDWVTGACMLVRREAIEDAGAMDEGFFLYMEDVEWCHRMTDHGWQVLLEPSASVVHHLGQAVTASGVVAQAYRDSLDRYCELYGLWGLKAVVHMGRALRGTPGGR
jgi:GT2 family glycosyltransferase